MVGVPIHSMVGHRMVPPDRRSERRMKPSININVEQSCLPLFTSGGKRSRSDGTLHLKAQDTDDIYWMQKNETNRNSGNSGKKDKPKSSSDNSNSNNQSNNNPKSTSASTSKSKFNSGNSASKSSNKPKVNALTDKLGKDGKLTSDERERCMKEKLCLYCGKPGHKASECNKSASAAAKGCVATVDSTESKK